MDPLKRGSSIIQTSNENSSTSRVLPVELYRPIVENLSSTADLYPLLFVSWSLNLEAERSIYDTIIIRLLSDTQPNDTALERLVDCPRVAALVHTFAIPTTISGTQSRDYTSFWRTVHRALQSMTNLLYLTIEDSLSLPPLCPRDCLLWNCSFKLKALTFGSIDVLHYGILLSYTIDLEEFAAWDCLKDFLPSSELFPRLETLGCEGEDVERLLNAMPRIKKLQWTAGVAPDFWKPPFHMIRTLVVHCHSSMPYFLPPILSGFPSLVYLKCLLLGRGTRLVRPELFLPKQEHGQLMPSLKKIYLEMRFISYDQCMRTGVPDYSVLFARFAALSVITLQFIDRCSQWTVGQLDKPSDVQATPEEWREDR